MLPYVAPAQAVDMTHPALSQKPGIYGMGLFLDTSVSADAILLRSPALLATNGTDPHDEAITLRDYIQTSGIIDPKSPRYSHYVHCCCQMLYPRRGMSNADVFHKLTVNQVGALGRYTSSLYGLSSLLNHSCTPNCSARQDDLLRERIFFSLRDVAPGELYISYIVFPVDNRAARAKLLWGVGFKCACPSCETDTPPSLQRYTHVTYHCWECARTAQDSYRCRCNATYCSARCRRANAATHRKICSK